MSLERLWILLAKKKSGEATPAELEELREIMAANAATGFSHEIIDKIWDSPLESVPENNAPKEIWQRLESRTLPVPRERVRIAWTRRWAVAATILLALTVGALAVLQHRQATPGTLAAAQQHINQVSTQPGSRSKLELPDGTQVWLNGNSKLTYSNGDFGRTDREVVLTGEAFFDVVKNEKVPFIIHTGPVNITVKGTAFNVKAYPKERTIETSLVRGLVEITTEQDPDRKILLKPNEKIIIPVNRAHSVRGVVLPDSAGAALYSITKLRTSAREPEEIAWVNSQLVFDDEPLQSIALKMENWYHIRVHFTSESVRQRHFSGVIEDESVTETLSAMQLSYPFTYELKGNDLWIGDKSFR